MAEHIDHTRALLERASTVVDQACTLIGEMLLRPRVDWKKSDRSPVTDIDLAVDELLRTRLMKLLPTAGWLSEETVDDRGRLDTDQVWVVDPIDGTRSLIDGIPEFCVSVALVDNGVPTIGLIANPSTGERFYAARGQGAWDESGKPLHVADNDPNDGLELVVSRSEVARGIWTDLDPKLTATPMSGLAYKMAKVASGRADGTMTVWPRREWDVAAACVIVAEAGGLTTELAGTDIDFNRAKPVIEGLVCGSRRAFDTILGLRSKVMQRRQEARRR